VPAGPPQTSGKAIISLVCGLLIFVPLAFIAAIVFGHLALSEIKKSAGRLKGEGMAIAGLVLGYLWVAGIPIILIIAAIAIPNLLRARMAANESSAVDSLRTLNTAEITYNSTYPDKGFTCNLSELGGGEGGGGVPDSHHAMLIDSVLARGLKSGYIFSVQGCTAENGVIVSYEIEAHPATRNQTGIRSFCAIEDAVIRVEPSGEAVTSAAGCRDITPLSQ
jgi:energy-coupling factor transporter transmembrane protein EcfT